MIAIHHRSVFKLATNRISRSCDSEYKSIEAKNRTLSSLLSSIMEPAELESLQLESSDDDPIKALLATMATTVSPSTAKNFKTEMLTAADISTKVTTVPATTESQATTLVIKTSRTPDTTTASMTTRSVATTTSVYKPSPIAQTSVNSQRDTSPYLKTISTSDLINKNVTGVPDFDDILQPMVPATGTRFYLYSFFVIFTA